MSDPFGFDSVDPIALRAAGSMKWNKFDSDVLPMWVADMDFKVAPPIAEALSKYNDSGMHGYPAYSVTNEFFDSFCDWVNPRFGLGAERDLIKTCADVVQALYATVFGFSEPGDGVVILTPLYPPFATSVSTNRRRIVEHRMAPDSDGVWRVDREKLRAQIEKERPSVFLLCSPHNPVGRLWDRDELEFFGSLVLEFDMTLVADEIHSDLIFCDRPMIGFASLSDEIRAHTVTITSANKPFNLAGLKVATIVFGSMALFDRFRYNVPGMLVGPVPTAGMIGATAAYRQGAPWLAGACSYLRENLDVFAVAMADRAPAVGVVRSEATYLAWLDFSAVAGVLQADGAPTRSVGERLILEAKLGINEGQTFGARLEHFGRINLATSRHLVLDAVERIGRWVDAQ